MVYMPPIEVIDRRRVRGVIRAYLDGEQDLTWVRGCVGSSRVASSEVKRIMEELRAYGPGPRWEELFRELSP